MIPENPSSIPPRPRWIDISMPISSGMVHWPGDPPARIEQTLDIANGAPFNLSALSLSSHTGTHMDAPLHFIPGGAGIDEMPLSAVMGRARVIEIRDPSAIGPAELAGHHFRRGERILFKTRNSGFRRGANAFVEDFVYISEDGAEFLAQRGVRTVGIDYLSVGGFKSDGAETHRALLGAGIWVIEGLDLSAVEPGAYDLVCLPLKLQRCDGAPARAALRPVRPRRRTNK